MNKSFLTAVSALAIIATSPALAADVKSETNTSYKTQSERTQGQNTIPEIDQQDIERGWDNTKDAVSEAADEVSEATEKTYDNIKSALTGRNTTGVTDVQVDRRLTAKGMIGKPVYNANGERVAKVKDIILDRDGEATMVIMANGDFTGLGKLVALDYDSIIGRKEGGEFIAPLTEEMIKNLASFSYDREDYSADVQVIPSNGYSTAALLDSTVVNADGKKVAKTNNISFDDGVADQIIVQYGDILGFGGEKAALEYDHIDLTRNDNKFKFRLSSNQAAEFEEFKKTSLN